MFKGQLQAILCNFIVKTPFSPLSSLPSLDEAIVGFGLRIRTDWSSATDASAEMITDEVADGGSTGDKRISDSCRSASFVEGFEPIGTNGRATEVRVIGL